MKLLPPWVQVSSISSSAVIEFTEEMQSGWLMVGMQLQFEVFPCVPMPWLRLPSADMPAPAQPCRDISKGARAPSHTTVSQCKSS